MKDRTPEYKERRLNDYKGNKVLKVEEPRETYYIYTTQEDDLINVYRSLEALKRDN